MGRGASAPVIRMRPLVFVLPALLVLALASEAQASSTAFAADDCNPEWGPFDPCLYYCGQPGSLQCRALGGALIIGGAVWDCVVDPAC